MSQPMNDLEKYSTDTRSDATGHMIQGCRKAWQSTQQIDETGMVVDTSKTVSKEN